MANKANKEQLRRYINNSEEIIFAEQVVASDSYNNSSEGLRGYAFEPIRAYLDEARIQANISKQINECYMQCFKKRNCITTLC